MEEFGGVLEYMWGVNGRHDKNNKAGLGLPAANQTRRGRFCKGRPSGMEMRPECLGSNYSFSFWNVMDRYLYYSAERLVPSRGVK